MTTRVTRKITVGLEDAIAFLDGDRSRATVVQKGDGGEWHDITEQWVNTRGRREGASAGTDMDDEASDPKGAQGASEAP